MTAWSEALPGMNSLLSEFPSVITHQMEAFREGIEKHFLWTQNSGTSAGEPAYSSASTTPGAARAFFAPASAVSASKNGRLFIASDTHALYAVPSDGSVRIFSPKVIIGDCGSHQSVVFGLPSFESMAPSTSWVVQSGSTFTFSSTATIRIAFPATYLTPPRVMLCALISDASNNGVLLSVTSITGSSMSVRPAQLGAVTSWGVMWRSAGTI